MTKTHVKVKTKNESMDYKPKFNCNTIHYSHLVPKFQTAGTVAGDAAVVTPSLGRAALEGRGCRDPHFLGCTHLHRVGHLFITVVIDFLKQFLT